MQCFILQGIEKQVSTIWGIIKVRNLEDKKSWCSSGCSGVSSNHLCVEEAIGPKISS